MVEYVDPAGFLALFNGYVNKTFPIGKRMPTGFLAGVHETNQLQGVQPCHFANTWTEFQKCLLRHGFAHFFNSGDSGTFMGVIRIVSTSNILQLNVNIGTQSKGKT
jgi:hypothetical protein